MHQETEENQNPVPVQVNERGNLVKWSKKKPVTIKIVVNTNISVKTALNQSPTKLNLMLIPTKVQSLVTFHSLRGQVEVC